MDFDIADEVNDRLAAMTGESITVAVRTAIEERLVRLRHQQHAVAGKPDLQELIERGRARVVLDGRSEDDILGYDSSGVPRSWSASTRRPRRARQR